MLGSSPCSFYWAPDYRKITDMDVRKALAYAYPYQDAWAAGGEIVGVTRVPGTNLMPPGIPGRTEFNPLPDHEPGTTNADKAKQLLQDSGNLNYPIQFLYAQDDPISVDTKDAIVKGLKAAGFDPQPYATTVADTSTLRADPDTKINVRSVRMVLRLADRLVVVPAGDPVDEHRRRKASGATTPSSASRTSTSRSPRSSSCRSTSRTRPGTTWTSSSLETYFPLFSTGYAGVDMMHGSKIHGMYNDNTYGMPDLEGHLGQQLTQGCREQPDGC